MKTIEKYHYEIKSQIQDQLRAIGIVDNTIWDAEDLDKFLKLKGKL